MASRSPSKSFSKEIKKTKLYKEAEVFYEKEFVDSENIVEPIPDIGDNKPSYNSLNLKIDQNKIDQFIKKHEITKNILFTSVFAYALSRFTNSSNSYFTIIENGRDRLNAFNAIGMFVNTLPILVDCSSDSVVNFIAKCKDKIYQTIYYNFYPFRVLKNKYNVTANVEFQYYPIISNETETSVNGSINFEDIKKRTDLISDLSFAATDNFISVISSKKYSPKITKKKKVWT